MKIKSLVVLSVLLLTALGNCCYSQIVVTTQANQRILVKGEQIFFETQMDTMMDRDTKKYFISYKMIEQHFFEIVHDSLKYYELKRVYSFAPWKVETGDTLTFKLKTFFIPLKRIDIKACEVGSDVVGIYQTQIKKEAVIDWQMYSEEGPDPYDQKFSYIYMHCTSGDLAGKVFDKIKMAAQNAK